MIQYAVYIAGLIHRQREGEALSEKETADVNAWTTSDNRRQLYALLNNRPWIVQQLRQLNSINTSEQVEIIFNRLSLPTTQPPGKYYRVIPLKRWSKFMAAAAVLVLVAAVYWFTLQNNATHPAIPAGLVKTDITPGRNKAFLTLSNGATVTLDSAGNGLLANEGNARVSQTTNGVLQYHITAKSTAQSLQYNTLSTPRGGKYQLQLPDGTMVWLNAASSIRYPVEFATSERRVEITGEAYFEVAQKSRQPFYVNINNTAEVQVLGTSFNVNAYKEEEAMLATLVNGQVKVKQGAAVIALRPNEQAVITSQQTIQVKKVDAAENIAWIKGYFHFNNADIKTVMRQLSRWYDVEVEFAGNPPARKFEGEIQSSLPLSELLTELSKNQVHFKVEGRKIIVMP